MREQAFIVRTLLRATRAVAVIGLSFCACGNASATGFFINQQSVLGLGRVDAGNSAAADELATIFFNPAGLSQFLDRKSGLQYSVGVHVIVPRSTQRNTGSTFTFLNPAITIPVQGNDEKNPTRPTPVPSLYLGKALEGGASVGVGVNSPFGLRAEFGKDWYGRYDAIEASLRTINLSLVGAYRQPHSKFSLGGASTCSTPAARSLPPFRRVPRMPVSRRGGTTTRRGSMSGSCMEMMRAESAFIIVPASTTMFTALPSSRGFSVPRPHSTAKSGRAPI